MSMNQESRKSRTVCFKWTTIRRGEEACFRYYKTGPKEYTSIAADGSLNATITDID
jgi:hypothetical protein